MIRVKLAWRNIFRNARRTSLVMAMIIGGFAAIVLFRGFSSKLNEKLEEATIRAQYGHLQVAKITLWNREPVDDQNEKLIENPDKMTSLIKDDPAVLYASGRMSFYALINSRDRSISAQAISFNPQIESQMLESLSVVEGQNFSLQSDDELLIGSGLQKQLLAKIGERVTLLSQTVDGAMNAIDMEVRGVFETKVSQIDDTTFFITLPAAQRLLDTDRVERIVVTLKKTKQVDSAFQRLKPVLELDTSMKLRRWIDLADFYRQVIEFWDVQNGLVGAILVSIIFLGILNIAGMAVFERTGEIGTVRALGDTRWEVIRQFLFEGLLLGLISCIVAVPVTFVLGAFINNLGIQIVIPGASALLEAEIGFVGTAFRDAFLLTVTTTVLATLAPAIRASRLNIVEALRKNI